MSRPGRSVQAFDVTIEKLVHGGTGLGRHQGKVVFVPFSVPGDQLSVCPVEEKKTFVRADIVRVLKPGDGRVETPCPHFGNCGGCHLQQLEYSKQVEVKRQILEEILYHRLPETRQTKITMRACTQPFGYRSRARIQMRGTGQAASIGYYRHRSHAVENVERCPLLRPLLNEALSELRQSISRMDPDTSSREIDLACSHEEGTWTTACTGQERGGTGRSLPGTANTEDAVLTRKVNGFLYSVTASVFFQANDFMVPELAARVQEITTGNALGSALDLYAGVGLFSIPLAGRFGNVVAIENSPDASRLCAANAATAGLQNIQTVCADAASWIGSTESSGSSRFDLIVLDPPRSGAEPPVMEFIKRQAPATIIYVSCDPQTLSRDLACISPGDYTIDFVEGMDMFPQTYHFETIVRLVRN